MKNKTEKLFKQLLDFFNIKDENGEANFDKVQKYQKILRRIETTDKNQSVEAVENNAVPNGIIIETERKFPKMKYGSMNMVPVMF